MPTRFQAKHPQNMSKDMMAHSARIDGNRGSDTQSRTSSSYKTFRPYKASAVFTLSAALSWSPEIFGDISELGNHLRISKHLTPRRVWLASLRGLLQTSFPQLQLVGRRARRDPAKASLPCSKSSATGSGFFPTVFVHDLHQLVNYFCMKAGLVG